jgi:hypothetical protein
MRAEQDVARQPPISISISFQHPFKRAGGRTSNVRQEMNRGDPIISWSEPATWRQTALAHAKNKGQSTFPWLPWIVVLGLVAGVITWEWSDADPTKRVGVPILMCIILALFGFFFAVA